MRFFGLGLRGKFLVALLASGALPILIGLVVFENRSYSYFLEERGKYLEMEAGNLSNAVDDAVKHQGRMLEVWLQARRELLDYAIGKNQEKSAWSSDQLASHKQTLDATWTSLPDDDPRLVEVLRNPGAQYLEQFRKINPDVAEILATDKNGCLIAATQKTTDYDQSDEKWWQHGTTLGTNDSWLDGLRVDTSAGVYSKDIVLPLYHEGHFCGLVKITVDITSLFAQVGAVAQESHQKWEIMLENGDVLACSESNYATLTRQIPKSTRLMVQQNANGWIQTQDDHGNLWLTGLRKMDSPDISQGAYLMFSSMRDDVVAPLQKRLLQIGTFSIIIFTLGALVGYAMIYHHVLRPLKALGSAMRSLTATVRSKPDSEAEKQEIIRLRNNVIRDLETVGKIRTGDEIEPLARNLSEMGEKLLRYQTELENKIESNSGKANADLRE